MLPRSIDNCRCSTKSAVAKGIKRLAEKGIITTIRNQSAERGILPTTYALRYADGPPLSTTKTRVVHQKDKPLSTKWTYQRQTYKKQKNKELSNLRTSPLWITLCIT